MAKTIALTLTEDEAEIIADALENDRDSYKDSAEDARKEGDRSSAEAFREAASRIEAVLARIRRELGE